MILNLATVKSFLLNPKELLFKYQHTQKHNTAETENTHTHTHTHKGAHTHTLRNKCCWPSCRAWGWAWSCPPPEPWGSFHWGGPWGAPPAPGCVPRSAAPGSHSGTATHPHTWDMLNKQVPQPVLCLVLLKTRLNQRLQCLFCWTKAWLSTRPTFKSKTSVVSVPSPFLGGGGGGGGGLGTCSQI